MHGMFERLKALYQRCVYRLTQYPNVDMEFAHVGLDDRGVVHALTWKFSDTEGGIVSACGASIDIKEQGTINCMTCLVLETRFTR